MFVDVFVNMFVNVFMNMFMNVFINVFVNVFMNMFMNVFVNVFVNVLWMCLWMCLWRCLKVKRVGLTVIALTWIAINVPFVMITISKSPFPTNTRLVASITCGRTFWIGSAEVSPSDWGPDEPPT